MNNTKALALILISFGLFFFMAKPLFNSISVLQKQKQEYRAAIDRVRQVEEKRDKLLTKLNDIPALEKARVESFLPTEDEVVRLMADIDAIASKYGISIEEIKSGPANFDAARSTSEAPRERPYNSKLLSFSFSSDYQNLAGFLIDLEKSLRIIDIRSIEFSQGSDSESVYRYRVDAEVYWVNKSK